MATETGARTEEVPNDTFSITLNNGRYLSSIGREGDTRSLTFNSTPNFYELLSRFGEYNANFIHNYYCDIIGFPDRITPGLRQIQLKLECDLPEPERKALEQMVRMHNELVREIREKAKAEEECRILAQEKRERILARE